MANIGEGETVDGRVIATEIGREIVPLMPVGAGTGTTEAGETIPLIKAEDREKVLLTLNPAAGEGIVVTVVRHPLKRRNLKGLRCVFLIHLAI